MSDTSGAPRETGSHAQLRIDDRLGTYADVAASAKKPLRTVLDAVRGLNLRLHPGDFETASRAERSVWWGVAPGKAKTAYAYAMPHASHVNLGFVDGVDLPDPGRQLEGTGKRLRHLRLRQVGEVEDAHVTELLRAARALRAVKRGHA